jgi:hypothetical protein
MKYAPKYAMGWVLKAGPKGPKPKKKKPKKKRKPSKEVGPRNAPQPRP